MGIFDSLTACMVNFIYQGGNKTMHKVIDAVYEDGVFKPTSAVKIKEHTKVHLTIEEVESIAFSTSGMVPARNKQSVDNIALEPEFLPEEE
jgi:predicted DNA-binding antitoxin AbrB/MazE fold protein